MPAGAGHHPKPSHLNPRELLDHVGRNHGLEPAQCEQAEAIIIGVMPGGLAGPFAVAKAGSWMRSQPRGVQSSRAKETPPSVVLSGASESAAVSSTAGTGVH